MPKLRVHNFAISTDGYAAGPSLPAVVHFRLSRTNRPAPA
jgi:hypothetical protein